MYFMKIPNQRNTILWQGMLCGSLFNLMLIALSLMQYPSLLDAGRASTVIACVVLLLLYGCVGIGLPLQASQPMLTALWQGTGFGLLVGVLFVADIAVEYFLNMSSQLSTLSTFGFMGLIFLLFVLAGARGTQRTGQFLLGSLTSIWSAMLGVLIAVLFGFAVNFFFIQRLEHILASDYVSSGMRDIRAFTFFNSLDSASSHLLEGPILAAVLGTISALTIKGLMSLRGKHLFSSKRSS